MAKARAKGFFVQTPVGGDSKVAFQSGVHKGGLVKGGLAIRQVFNSHIKSGT